MVEVCEGAPVAVSGWVLADGHDLRPCAASSLHRGTMSVSNVIGGSGKLVVERERNETYITTPHYVTTQQPHIVYIQHPNVRDTFRGGTCVGTLHLSITYTRYYAHTAST